MCNVCVDFDPIDRCCCIILNQVVLLAALFSCNTSYTAKEKPKTKKTCSHTIIEVTGCVRQRTSSQILSSTETAAGSTPLPPPQQQQQQQQRAKLHARTPTQAVVQIPLRNQLVSKQKRQKTVHGTLCTTTVNGTVHIIS